MKRLFSFLTLCFLLINISTTLFSGTGYFEFENHNNMTAENVNVIESCVVNISDLDICISETTQVEPVSGGTWTSSNNNVAVVTNAGVVTAVGPGVVDFTFTSASGDCSATTDFLIVNADPTVTIAESTICANATTNASPNSGGTWMSNNPSVATVSNSGIVTGISQGIAELEYTESFSGCSSSVEVTVQGTPISVTIADTELCVNAQTNATSTGTGTWTSSDNSIAEIDNTGTVTALNAGVVTFTFTSIDGCSSDTTDPLVVNADPTVTIAESTICTNATTNVSPNSGGTWTSNNPSVATVSNSGIVTGISQGVAELEFTASFSGCSSSVEVTVQGTPVSVTIADTELCVNAQTIATSTGTGTWISSDNSIAEIDNTGTVTALNAGVVTFTFTSIDGCSSDTTDPLVVNADPSVTIAESTICTNATTNVSPNSGGTWTSNNPSVATVSNSGIVTGISQGLAELEYTESFSGCSSSVEVTVQGTPVSVTIADTELCVNAQTNATSTGTGTWTSSDSSIAEIDNTGTVTALNAGVVTFTFTSIDGCSSDTTDPLVVNADPVVVYTGSDEIEVGQTTSLSPSAGGSWTSNDPSVASISNSGIASGIAVGITTFIFEDDATGCSSESDELIVNPAINYFSGPNPDWNNPANWSQGSVPANPLMEIVVLTSNVAYSGVSAFIVGNTGTLTINTDVVLTVNNDIQILEGGVLNNQGTINVAGE